MKQHKHHWAQSKALRYQGRRVALRAGRRSGKTATAKLKLVMALPVVHSHGMPGNYFYAGPVQQQAKETAWEDLKALVPKDWLKKAPSETELKIYTHWSTLRVVGLDKPHRIEGPGYDGAVVDESSDVKPEAISRSILPALADRKGWLWRIGVPKRFGVGAQAFNEWFDKITSGKINGLALEWPSSEILDPIELEEFRSEMTQEDFDEQFNAMILSIGGQVYYAFSKDNVQECKYCPELPIIVGMDFNVDPMCWVLCHEVSGELYVFDELYKRNTYTEDSLNRLHADYGDHSGGWVFHGDASSKARKTAAPITDYIQIANDVRFRDKRVSFPESNPLIANRLKATNRMLKNADGRVRIHIDPKCERLIRDLSFRSYKEGTSEIQDGPFMGHMSDALDYVVYARFPVMLDIPTGSADVLVLR